MKRRKIGDTCKGSDSLRVVSGLASRVASRLQNTKLPFGVAGSDAVMTSLMLLLVIAPVAALAFVMAVTLVRRNPLVGLGSAGLIVLLLWQVPHPPAIVTVFGLAVYPADVITLVLFSVGLLEVAQLRVNLRGWILLWWLFGLLIALSTFRGVAAFGPATAVNEARSLLYFFFTMTWVLATQPSRLRLPTFSLVLGWALVLVALTNAVTHGIGDASSSITVNGEMLSGRILVSGQALILLLCAGTVLLGTVDSRGGRQRSVISATVFLAVAVVAQHRSVLIATALAMVAVLVSSRRRRARSQIFVFFVVGTLFTLLGWSFGFFGSVSSDLVDAVLSTKTLDWRTSSWQSLISQTLDRGLAVIIGGEPFGGGFFRQLGRGWTSGAAHNWYVTIYLRLGIIGLTVLGVILAAAFVRSRSVSAEWMFSLAAVGVFGFGYTVGWYVAPWLGAALAVALGGALQSGQNGRDEDETHRVLAGKTAAPRAGANRLQSSEVRA